MSNLMLHSGGWLTDMEGLKAVPIPDATDTYTPVPHYDSVTTVVNYANAAGYTINKISLGLNKNGNHMFGVLDIDKGDDDMGWTMGIRNSYDKSLCFGLVGGARTFVCDNLCFSGDVIYTHKHTKGVSIEAGLDKVFNNVDDNMANFFELLVDTKYARIDKARASELTIDMVKSGAIPSYDVVKVMDEFINPTMPEFNQYADVLYGWVSAVTYVSKKYSPMKQMDTYSKLATLIKI
jgi:hypothetical protein